MRRKAFSLVELLTVIAILAILAAILFPVFIQVRNYARQYVAGQAMMKLTTSVAMYSTDYDDVYPVAYYTLQDGRRLNWFGIVGKDKEVVKDSGLIHPYI